jgi:hypothetical protein
MRVLGGSPELDLIGGPRGFLQLPMLICIFYILGDIFFNEITISLAHTPYGFTNVLDWRGRFDLRPPHQYHDAAAKRTPGFATSKSNFWYFRNRDYITRLRRVAQYMSESHSLPITPTVLIKEK